jgi:hypothetical protein
MAGEVLNRQKRRAEFFGNRGSTWADRQGARKRVIKNREPFWMTAGSIIKGRFLKPEAIAMAKKKVEENKRKEIERNMEKVV